MAKEQKSGFVIGWIVIITGLIIIIWGAFYFWRHYLPLASESKAPQKILSASSESKIDISTWKTYRNEKYRMIIKYPPDIKIKEYEEAGNTQFIEFFNESTDEKFSTSFLKTNSKRLDIVAWADQEAWPFSDKWRNHFIVVSIAGLEMLQNPVTDSVVFSKDEIVYTIANGIGLDPVLLKKEVFKRILETIEILDPVSQDISLWKTYRSEKYGFEVRYPSDARIKEEGSNQGTGPVLSGTQPLLFNAINFFRINGENQNQILRIEVGGKIKNLQEVGLECATQFADVVETQFIRLNEIDAISHVLDFSVTGIKEKGEDICIIGPTGNVLSLGIAYPRTREAISILSTFKFITLEKP